MNQYVFGVDIGGTTVKIGLLTKDGYLIESWEIKTSKKNSGENILPDIAESINEKIRELSLIRENILGIGLGVPGPVNNDGLVYVAVNLGWKNVNVAEKLQIFTGFKVKVGNDANMAALGEMWKGAGTGCKNIIMVTLGTGVGGGIIVDGNVVNGAKGSAGEIGHFRVEDNEVDSCACGKKGCLEQYSSATGIVRLAHRELEKNKEESLLRDICNISAKDVIDAAKYGDGIAIKVMDSFGFYLGKALAGIACVTNPEKIIIGGGVAKAGSILINYVKEYFEQFVFDNCGNICFELAVLGNDAGMYGAASLLLN